MKVTVDEATTTATKQALAQAAATVTVKDSMGRTITLKRPNVLCQYDLIEVLGDSAANSVYLGMTLPLIFVIEIDGEAVHMPTSKLQVRGLIQRLGEDGVNAVMKGVQEHFGGTDVDGDSEAIKK